MASKGYTKFDDPLWLFLLNDMLDLFIQIRRPVLRIHVFGFVNIYCSRRDPLRARRLHTLRSKTSLDYLILILVYGMVVWLTLDSTIARQALKKSQWVNTSKVNSKNCSSLIVDAKRPLAFPRQTIFLYDKALRHGCQRHILLVEWIHIHPESLFLSHSHCITFVIDSKNKYYC